MKHLRNGNKIPVTLRITVYAFSQTALRKSGPAGSRSQKSKKPEARMQLNECADNLYSAIHGRWAERPLSRFADR